MSVTDAEELALADDVALHPLAMNTLSPATSPKVRRTTSQRRSRAASYLPPHVPEAHEAAHNAVLAFLKGRTSYDALPVSFRLITLDTKLEVKKALQCLLAHGA
jgi:5'-AMP-activated protein kinase regulatory gamma subunit